MLRFVALLRLQTGRPLDEYQLKINGDPLYFRPLLIPPKDAVDMKVVTKAVASIFVASALIGTASNSVVAQDLQSNVQVQAPAGTYELDPTHAILLWSVKHNGISNYTARFSEISAVLKLDPGKIEESSIEVAIDPGSVETGYRGDYKGTHADSGFDTWDEEVARSPKFLNGDAYSTITFRSTKVVPTGPITADIIGDLDFLGVTKPVTLRATFNGEIEKHPFRGVPTVAFAAEGVFDRTEFGQPKGAVGSEVTIRFDGEFILAPATN
ncbi:YceI family protein [Paracoccus sp. (in: a-proteobacteria)]